MSFKQWKSILEFKKKGSNLTDDDRVNIIVDHLEKWSTKNCYTASNKGRIVAVCLSSTAL